MTLWMHLINQWVTLLLCYYDDFSILCITSCNRGFCSVTSTTINTLQMCSFRLCQPSMENIIKIIIYRVFVHLKKWGWGGCFYKKEKADACQRVPKVPPWVKGWALHTYFTLTWILHAIGAGFRISHATVKFIANPIQINSNVHLTWPVNSVSAGEYDRHSRCCRILHLAAANWSLVL